MAEEFVEDIIAGTATEESGKTAEGTTVDKSTTEAKVGEADAATTTDEAKIAADVDAEAAEAAAKDEAKNNSSSTPEELTAKKAADDSTSEGKSVAPGKPSEVEELASRLGWSKDHKGVESVDVATYILRSKDIQKTMKDHNKELKNQLNGLQGSVEALKDHNERVYHADVKKLQAELTGLKREKKAAVELADVAKVEALDQQIKDVQKDIDAPVKKDAAPVNPVYDEWVADNEWYLTDDAMAQYADTVADQYAGAPADRIYAIVRQKVAEVFPEKFAAEKTASPIVTDAAIDAEKVKSATEVAKKVVGPQSPVEKGTRTGDSASFTKADLSADQVTIMNQFVKGGIMTEDQYVADIAKMQGA